MEESCREAGRDPAEVPPSLMVMVIPENNPAAAEAERANFAVVPDSGVVAGSPDYCIERLGAYLKAGVRRLLLTIPFVDEKPERLRLAGEKILPALRNM